MVTAAIATAAGLGSTLYGYYKSGQEAKKQEAILKEAKDRADSYYNRNYYSDYFTSAEAQNAMRRVQQSLQRIGDAQRGRQAINGATDEATLAAREQGLETLSNTASNLASQSTSLKRDADKTYQGKMDRLDEANMAMAGQRMEGYTTLAGNGANVMAGGLTSVASEIGGMTSGASAIGAQTSAGQTSGAQEKKQGVPSSTDWERYKAENPAVSPSIDSELKKKYSNSLLGLGTSADGLSW